MKTSVGPGNTINYYNATSNTIASGAIVRLTNRIGVAIADIAPSTYGAIQVDNLECTLPKAAGALTLGQIVYANSTPAITATASGNVFAGYATEAATSAATTVKVKVNG